VAVQRKTSWAVIKLERLIKRPIKGNRAFLEHQTSGAKELEQFIGVGSK
jgi:hypothetical protein